MFIKDICPGTVVEGIFLVDSKTVRTTKFGNPFLSLILSDSSGKMEAKVWERADEFATFFDKGDFISIKADATEFNGKTQLNISDLALCSKDKIPIEYFVPVASIDLEKGMEAIERTINHIKDRILQALLTEIFSSVQLKQDFKHAPAAKNVHHAYIGGLLEHTLGLLELAKLICKRYRHLNQDLITSACILHDIGKTKELKWTPPPIDYTDEGRLLGHIAIGLEIVDSACNVRGLDPKHGSILALKHLILSHHGQKEFGSPVLPMTEEAVVFHMMDDMDAKLNFLHGLRQKSDLENSSFWSEYQRLFERHFYLPPIDMEMDKEDDSEIKTSTQSSLWDLKVSD